MKRSTFLKSIVLAVTAPIAIVKAKAAGGSPGLTGFLDQRDNPNGADLHLDHELYTWAVHKCGDHKKAAEFGTWYHQNLKYWVRELKRQGDDFWKSPKQVALLAQFEGQTFDNLWKLFNRSK